MTVLSTAFQSCLLISFPLLQISVYIHTEQLFSAYNQGGEPLPLQKICYYVRPFYQIVCYVYSVFQALWHVIARSGRPAKCYRQGSGQPSRPKSNGSSRCYSSYWGREKYRCKFCDCCSGDTAAFNLCTRARGFRSGPRRVGQANVRVDVRNRVASLLSQGITLEKGFI